MRQRDPNCHYNAGASLPAMESRSIVCILGMHRSGTSVVSRMMELIGAYLGPEDSRLPAASDNPTGFWEHRLLVAINDEILARLGGSWDNPPSVPEGWAQLPQLGDLRQRALDVLTTDFRDAPFWSWKDPRACLTAPFWQQLLPSMSYVICLRNPAAVARSLNIRNGFTIRKGGELWLSYTAAALRWTSGLPRLIVFYEDVMQDSERELKRVAAFLGKPTAGGRQEALLQFLEDDLHHHRSRISESVDDADLPFPAKSLYLALRARHTHSENGHADIDPAIDQFSARAHDRQIAEERDARQLAGLHREIAGLEQTVSELQESVSRVTAERDRQIVEYSHVAIQLASVQANRERLSAEVDRMTRAFEAQLEASGTMAKLSSGLQGFAVTLDALGLTRGRRGKRLRLMLALAIRPGRFRDAYAIAQSGIFDDSYYRTRYPDVERQGLAPLMHFVFHGASEGRNPHPLFDCRWYGMSNSNALAGSNPFVHYLRTGASAGLAPHPLFDVKHYVGCLEGRPLIDANPLIDYIRRGAVEGRSPHPLFDAGFYCERNPNVARAGVDPFVHFLSIGATTGCDPHPLFDCSDYLEQNPGVRASGLNPLEHFMDRGWQEGCQPSPRFDMRFYLESNEDVRSSGVNPLIHYLERGRQEGRRAVATSAPEPLGIPRIALAPLPVRLRTRSLVAVSPQTSASDGNPIVICLSHVMPWPPRAGNEYRIFRMLRWLKTAGYRVVPVIAPLPGVNVSEDAVRVVADLFSNAVLCRRDGQVDYILRDIPDALAAWNGKLTPPFAEILGESFHLGARDVELLKLDRMFCHDALIETAIRLSHAVGRHILLAEYVWMSRIMPLVPRQAMKVIDTIDVFSSKRDKVVQFGISDVHLEPDEEARRLQYADLVIAIHDDECRTLQELVPDKRVVTAGVDFDIAADSAPPRERRALLVASDNPMNRKGLRDFLRFAWPRIRQRVPDAELLIAGPVGATLTDDVPGLVRLGTPEDLTPLYRGARLVINPAVAGTGLKIKTIEALAHLRPIVAWPSGSDGLTPDVAALCRTVRDWYEFSGAVIDLLQCDEPVRFSSSERNAVERFIAVPRVYRDLMLALEAGWTEHFSETRDAAHTF